MHRRPSAPRLRLKHALAADNIHRRLSAGAELLQRRFQHGHIPRQRFFIQEPRSHDAAVPNRRWIKVIFVPSGEVLVGGDIGVELELARVGGVDVGEERLDVGEDGGRGGGVEHDENADDAADETGRVGGGGNRVEDDGVAGYAGVGEGGEGADEVGDGEEGGRVGGGGGELEG